MIRMKITGDKSESKSGIAWKKFKKAMFSQQVFRDLGMSKNNKGSMTWLGIIFKFINDSENYISTLK